MFVNGYMFRADYLELDNLLRSSFSGGLIFSLSSNCYLLLGPFEIDPIHISMTTSVVIVQIL